MQSKLPVQESPADFRTLKCYRETFHAVTVFQHKVRPYGVSGCLNTYMWHTFNTVFVCWTANKRRNTSITIEQTKLLTVKPCETAFWVEINPRLKPIHWCDQFIFEFWKIDCSSRLYDISKHCCNKLKTNKQMIQPWTLYTLVASKSPTLHCIHTRTYSHTHIYIYMST